MSLFLIYFNLSSCDEMLSDIAIVSSIYNDILLLYSSSFTYGINSPIIDMISSSRRIVERPGSLSSSVFILQHVCIQRFSKLSFICSISSMPFETRSFSNTMYSFVLRSPLHNTSTSLQSDGIFIEAFISAESSSASNSTRRRQNCSFLL